MSQRSLCGYPYLRKDERSLQKLFALPSTLHPAQIESNHRSHIDIHQTFKCTDSTKIMRQATHGFYKR